VLALAALFAELEGQCETFKANADGASIARIMKEHALSEEDANTWFSGGAGADPDGVAYAAGYKAGEPTLGGEMLRDCRALLIAAGVLPAGAAGTDVQEYCDCVLGA